MLVTSLTSARGWAQNTAADAGSTAQPPPPTTAQQDEGRRQFELGVEALRDERYADALAAFRASYAVRPAASVALNLGIALRALGRLVEARQYLDEFRRGASPTQHAEHDRVVNEYLADLERRIASLRVAEASPAELSVTLDGQPFSADANRAVPVDPGDHQLRASAPGFVAERQTIQIAPGEQATVRLVLRPMPAPRPAPAERRVAPPPPVVPVARPASADPPVYARWWFWTGIGVVAAAAVVIPIAVVASSGFNDPAGTNTGGVIQGVSW